MRRKVNLEFSVFNIGNGHSITMGEWKHQTQFISNNQEERRYFILDKFWQFNNP